MSDLLERMEEAWMGLSRRSFDNADAGIGANLCQEAIDEIRRLREAKQAALKIADERSNENVALRSQLARARPSAEQIARAICLSYGRDPDAPTSILEMCDAENRPVPMWCLYEEQADAVIVLTSG